jgi:hypothetical protein
MPKDGESVPWRSMAHDETCQTAGQTAECSRCVLKRAAKRRKEAQWKRTQVQSRRLRNALEKLATTWDRQIPTAELARRNNRTAAEHRGLLTIKFAQIMEMKKIVSVVTSVSFSEEYRRSDPRLGKITICDIQRRDAIRTDLHGPSFGTYSEGSGGKVLLNARGRRLVKRHPLPAPVKAFPSSGETSRMMGSPAAQKAFNDGKAVSSVPQRLPDGAVCYGESGCKAPRRTVHKVSYERGHKCTGQPSAADTARLSEESKPQRGAAKGPTVPSHVKARRGAVQDGERVRTYMDIVEEDRRWRESQW